MTAPDPGFRILLAEDEQMLREMLRAALHSRWPKAEIGEASDFSATIHMLQSREWDLVLLDVRLGAGRGGLDVLSHMRTLAAKPAVLVLSGYAERQLATRCIALGARGYIEKGDSLAELLAAVDRIVKGGMHVSPSVSSELALIAQGHAPEPHKRLTTREFDVFLRLASGRTVTEVANDMNLSPKTVGTHRTAILSKMQLRSTADVIKYAHENGLLH